VASSVVILYPYILLFFFESSGRTEEPSQDCSLDWFLLILHETSVAYHTKKVLYYKHSTQWQNSEILTKSIQQNRNIKLSIFWHNTIVVCIISFSSLQGKCCGGKLFNPANKVLHKMTALY